MRPRPRGPVDPIAHWSGRLALCEAGHLWEWLDPGWHWYGAIEDVVDIPIRHIADLERLRALQEDPGWDARSQVLSDWWGAKTR